MITDEGIHELNHPDGTAVCVGKFDGLHLGHQRIVEETVREAREKGLLSAVLAIFTPGAPRIFTREETAGFLREMGVDVFLSVPFTEEFRNTDAEKFLQRDLLGTLRMKACFSGEDFRFGKGGQGSASLLQEKSAEEGFTYRMVPDFCFRGRTIRSSLIRERLALMDVRTANEMLGRPYSLSGTVAHGRRLGSRIGYPTVNVVPAKDKFLPGFGVYAAELSVLGPDGRPENEKPLKGILDLGVKPTVQGNGDPALEIHLLDFDGDLYGKKVSVSFLQEIRPEKHFPSVEALKRQIAEDVQNVQTLFKE